MTSATTLPTRQLGSTGMDITAVGFGAWAVGGGGWRFGWGPQDDADSTAAVLSAVEGGVNWVDTAPVYGLGRSEEVVGGALRRLSEPDRPYVFTKCGLVFDRAHPEDGPRNVLAPASIRRELDESLRRLGVDHVDLYQVHWPPDDGTPLEVYWATMLELRDEGKVRAVGLSNHTAEQVAAAEAIGHVDSLQPPFSMIRRGTAADLLPLCAANRTGVLAYSPLQSGLLTGAMTAERVAALPEDDWRHAHEDFAGEALDRNIALAEALRPVAERHDVSPSAVAVAWVLSWPGVSGAIVGGRTPEQVRGWLAAASLALTLEDLRDLRQAIVRTRAGSGPVAPATIDG